MLSQGIFLWESRDGELSEVISRGTFSSTYPELAEDFDRHGPWREVVDIEGAGRFVRGRGSFENTTVLVGECSSSMEVARDLVERGILGEWGAVIAVEQTRGRGQLRRHWISPPGNLHVSVVLPNRPKAAAWEPVYAHLVPLLAGYVFSDVLESMGAEVRIKWPNDLLQGERKVGGMLVEERNGLIILGLGLNLVESPSDDLMREDHSAPAGVLQLSQTPSGPLTLWEILVNRGKSVYMALLDEFSPSDFLAAVTRRLAWVGRSVRVCEGGDNFYCAEIIGISPEGGLVVRREGKDIVLFSCSITPL